MGNIFSSFIQSPLPMFILMFAVLYFVLIRPQMKEQKNTQAMIDKQSAEQERFDALLHAIVSRETDPYTAAASLMEEFD